MAVDEAVEAQRLLIEAAVLAVGAARSGSRSVSRSVSQSAAAGRLSEGDLVWYKLCSESPW